MKLIKPNITSTANANDNSMQEFDKVKEIKRKMALLKVQMASKIA